MRNLFTLALLSVTSLLLSQNFNHANISEKVLEKIELEADAYHSIHIILADQVDFQALEKDIQSRNANLHERAKTVISALQEKAEKTQVALLEYIESSSNTNLTSLRSFWIANVISVSAKKELIAELSWRNDIQWIGLNGPIKRVYTEKSCIEDLESYVPNGIEPGLAAINAPALWAMGYTGYGQVGFTADTGVHPEHPAIKGKFRGWYVEPNVAWYQWSGGTDPFDCDDHGTHVTGTMMGLDRLTHDTIGVAFNAQWVGAPILCGIGTSDNIGAFQWALNPDGNTLTTDDMPDVINNSWYDPQITNDCNSVYVPVLEALETAGVAVILAAGNFGPGVQTIASPHNINVNIVNSFSVGAVNGNNSNLPVADFSGRGPSTCGGDSSLLIKPEVSAPGVSVRSSVPGGYDFFNGTSMATPHVAGAVMLLKEAFPEATGKELKLALYFSCTDLGEPGEDNDYGMGIIDVLAAYNYLIGEGHIPESPIRALDALVIDVTAGSYACNYETESVVLVENNGTDTIYSLSIKSETPVDDHTDTWSGVLAPKDRIYVPLSSIQTQAGGQTLRVEILSVNGVDDERPFNNIFEIQVIGTNREGFDAFVVSDENNVVCENNPALLRGIYTGEGDATFKWYDGPMGGNLLAEGEVFETSSLTAGGTWYVNATYSHYLGLGIDEVPGRALLDNASDGLVFNVEFPVMLKSVKVYAEDTGIRIIKVTNSTGEQLHSKAAIISQKGENIIETNFNLEPGFNYRLVLDLGKEFHSNEDGAQYPYNLSDFVSIIGNTNPGDSDAWYYFYDWVIEYDEPCGLQSISVDVVPGTEAPVADFSQSADTLNIAEVSGVVDFLDNSTNAITWSWHFGDGQTSNEQNPSHEYTSEGIYTITLAVKNAEGCSDHFYKEIVIINEPISDVKEFLPDFNFHIYPNPTEDIINIAFEGTENKKVTLSLIDVFGKEIGLQKIENGIRGSVTFDLSEFSNGVYFLIFEQEGLQVARKIVKQ